MPAVRFVAVEAIIGASKGTRPERLNLLAWLRQALRNRIRKTLRSVNRWT
jgi:hypothetical protein